MRFLVDECTGPQVALWLESQGHEVYSVYAQARGLDDDTVLRKASGENWILITNDKDFGEMVYRQRLSHKGVIFLRLQVETPASKIDVLRRLLETCDEAVLKRFLVVTEKGIRSIR